MFFLLINVVFFSIKWAQLVLTIERSCSAKQRFDYQGQYAIGTDDKRDLMVIKRATKSKAAQRKGAIGNWKVNRHKKRPNFSLLKVYKLIIDQHLTSSLIFSSFYDLPSVFFLRSSEWEN